MPRPFFASGDPVLFLTLAAILLLVGAALGVAVTGAVMMSSKTAERKKLGRRLLAYAALPIFIAIGAWLAMVGFD